MSATGTFVIDSWEPQPPVADQDGIAVTQVTLRKTFRGDLTGSSVVFMTMGTTPVEESRTYVAIEHVTGELDGRKGSFLLQHTGISDEGEQSLRVSVVPDSGTGELTGLRGEMRIHIAPDGSHSYTFDR
ncbi:DUF3224 domain-containing protein [Nonomuraea sp. NPDC050663]|uniref:DUF3224 domain-containing protein n=1 Tax=Nonomuraea sp. NPDC050663 TaxID=3364370 RepID=UPI00379B697F